MKTTNRSLWILFFITLILITSCDQSTNGSQQIPDDENSTQNDEPVDVQIIEGGLDNISETSNEALTIGSLFDCIIASRIQSSSFPEKYADCNSFPKVYFQALSIPDIAPPPPTPCYGNGCIPEWRFLIPYYDLKALTFIIQTENGTPLTKIEQLYFLPDLQLAYVQLGLLNEDISENEWSTARLQVKTNIESEEYSFSSPINEIVFIEN